jgi:ssDNA-binding Zn-finger/Zn-ribbon topoisomerase 1
MKTKVFQLVLWSAGSFLKPIRAGAFINKEVGVRCPNNNTTKVVSPATKDNINDCLAWCKSFPSCKYISYTESVLLCYVLHKCNYTSCADDHFTTIG